MEINKNSSSLHTPSFSVFFQLALMVGGFLFLYHHTIFELTRDWIHNDNYSHGLLVPVISAYMIWHQKSELRQLSLRPNNFGLIWLGFGMFLHIVGTLGAEQFTMRLSIIMSIWGMSIYLLGKDISSKILFPIVYLIFMIPLPGIIWNKIAFPLQILASKFTAIFVGLIGISILREGNILHLANTTLEVVDACSGLRSLTSLLALSAAFSYFVPLRIFSKWLLFLSAIPIAVIINVFRLTSTAVLARTIGPETAQGFLHDFSGILVFCAALIFLYLMYLLLLKAEKVFYASSEIQKKA